VYTASPDKVSYFDFVDTYVILFFKYANNIPLFSKIGKIPCNSINLNKVVFFFLFFLINLLGYIHYTGGIHNDNSD
jgi:hypothetical protein